MTPVEDLRAEAKALRDEVREVRTFLENWHIDPREVQA